MSAERKAGRFRRDLLPLPANYYTEALRVRVDRGGWTTTRCVFHEDRRPSLSVNIDTGAFRCHACGEHGGSVLDFHMQRYGLDFVTAARELGAWV